jgi:hypothetical protein
VLNTSPQAEQSQYWANSVFNVAVTAWGDPH